MTASENPGSSFRFSDTQAYKRFGNAVVVPVVEAIAKHMLPCIIQNCETLSLPKH
ncbi:DNA cytosine methyltransferase [Promineifilum sp.]|uniref:DNA cytosine methyltransferase n=1 Tax=Promineifilum sp. TaxID=2664178 RepID=UPI0031CCA876